MDSLTNTDDDFVATCRALGVRYDDVLSPADNARYLVDCDRRLHRTPIEELRDISQELLGMASSGEIVFADADAAARFRVVCLQIRGRRFEVIQGGRQ